MRIAIVCDEGFVPRWLHPALERLHAVEGVDLVLAFVASRSCVPRCRDCAGAAETWAFRRVPALGAAGQPDEWGHIPTVHGHGAPAADMALAVDCRLDRCAALRWAPSLGTCTLAVEGAVGVRGLREAVFAFARRQPYLRFSLLLAMANESDGPRIIRDGAVRMAHSHVKSLDTLFAAAGHALASAIHDLVLGGPSTRQWPVHAPQPALRRLGAGMIGACYMYSAGRFSAKIARGALYFEKWNFGLCAVPPDGFLGLSTAPQATWLPECAGLSYVADPFAASSHHGLLLLAERFEERRNRGSIVSINWDGAAEAHMSSAIDRNFHLSYPYLFRDGDHLYCVPEAAESGRVILFRAGPEPGQWRELGTLIHFAAVDPTIFYRSGHWWLFCTSPDRSELPSASTKLYVWFAETLTGPWRPHPLNPVKTDVRSSRPAGAPFIHGGRLYRPAQDCSETYGGAISLVEIVELSETTFAERLVTRIGADLNGPYPHGLHTLVRAGNGSAIDGKRRVFSLRLPWIKLLRRLAWGERHAPPTSRPTSVRRRGTVCHGTPALDRRFPLTDKKEKIIF